ncbi:MAG: hypothetical protein RL021_158 [Bacteroidota bacterium]|jgi:4-hydroxybenzoate polyprenyltransferase
MLTYLRLIRVPNLVLLALTFYLVRHCIVLPAFQVEYNNTGNYPVHLSDFRFMLLTAATLLVAAAGYIINEVFDVTADAVNRPGTNPFESRLSKGSGRTAFYILGTAGAVMGFVAGADVPAPAIRLIHAFSVLSLWMYSSYYKRRLLSGNLLIALLSGLAVILTGLYETAFYPNMQVLLPFSVFAFMVSLVREIIKDMEDLDGDERMQCKTLPIRFGIRTSKALVLSLLASTVALQTWLLHTWFADSTVVTWWNVLLLFALPLAGLGYLIATGESSKDYHFASLYTKGYMLLGILSILPFWYYFLR